MRGVNGTKTVFFSSSHQLSGPIPAELGQLGALIDLYLYDNQLTGQEAFCEYMDEHCPGCYLEM